jgi:hypothetical protein
MTQDIPISKGSTDGSKGLKTHRRTVSMEASPKNSTIPNVAQRNPFHPFMRPNHTFENDMTIPKSASMSHFFRSFRTLGGSSIPTQTQQDVYSLENDLGKLLQGFYAKSQRGHFTDPHSTPYGYTEEQGKRPLRQSLTDIFNGNTTPTSETAHDLFPNDESYTHIILARMMGIIIKHKYAIELPFPGEVLAIFSIPFDRVHIDGNSYDLP